MSGLILIIVPEVSIPFVEILFRARGLPVARDGVRRLVTVSAESYGDYRYKFCQLDIDDDDSGVISIEDDCIELAMPLAPLCDFIKTFLNGITFEKKFFGCSALIDNTGFVIQTKITPFAGDISDEYYSQLLTLCYTNIASDLLEGIANMPYEVTVHLDYGSNAQHATTNQHFWCVQFASQIVERHAEIYGL